MGIPSNHPAIKAAVRNGLLPADAVPPTPGEVAFADVAAWCAARGWEAPVVEFRLHPKRRWRFDAAFPVARVAIEFQGGVWSNGRHNRPAGFAADCEKLSAAAALGWRVLPVTYGHLKSGQLLRWLEAIFDGRTA